MNLELTENAIDSIKQLSYLQKPKVWEAFYKFICYNSFKHFKTIIEVYPDFTIDTIEDSSFYCGIEELCNEVDSYKDFKRVMLKSKFLLCMIDSLADEIPADRNSYRFQCIYEMMLKSVLA